VVCTGPSPASPAPTETAPASKPPSTPQKRRGAETARAKRGGSIVNIASMLGLRVGIGYSHYCTAKAGVVQLTKSLALELAR
jgi:NAD(P)-dependent dehydrogenase (short-subunit alcohol dehydrogenase family)